MKGLGEIDTWQLELGQWQYEAFASVEKKLESLQINFKDRTDGTLFELAKNWSVTVLPRPHLDIYFVTFYDEKKTEKLEIIRKIALHENYTRFKFKD